MKKFLLLLLTLVGCSTITEPALPSLQPLAGAYRVVDFYRPEFQMIPGPSTFRIWIAPENETSGMIYTTTEYYTLLEGRKIRTISPFNSLYTIEADTLRILNANQTWLQEAKFHRWKDGLLIGRWVPDSGPIMEITLQLEQ